MPFIDIQIYVKVTNQSIIYWIREIETIKVVDTNGERKLQRKCMRKRTVQLDIQGILAMRVMIRQKYFYLSQTRIIQGTKQQEQERY